MASIQAYLARIPARHRLSFTPEGAPDDVKNFALALAAMPLSASANDYVPAMDAYLTEAIMSWASEPVLIEAVLAQNASYADIDQGQIDAMDLAWRAEIGSGSTPTIDPVISNEAADFLRDQIDASGGRMTEIILMDDVGLNAAVSHITSDMWQGDEAKYSETYGVGVGAVHFGDIEKDESSGRYQAQISFTLVDPATGEAIGAITVGVDADALL